ncbi:glycosyltransferase [Neorhizobium lilium]|uniref:Glycosyltransferase n=1 Tax=Neorhizobium lilium TaxID=2503024 RepID=A0A3S3RP73_9HYPH|nr:glycosyltransferase [Neorhizobium lilium]RWX81117.1 glycosyltransferase [Neorhizobium lilium]
MKNDVCFLVRAFSGGGAQRDAVLLANGLANAGLSASIAVLDASGPLRSIVDPKVTIHDLGRGKKLRMAFALPRLLSSLASSNPTVLIAAEASGNVLASIAVQLLPKAKRPRLVLREVASPLQARTNDPYAQNRVAYRLAPMFYPRADLVIALTEGVRLDLINHFRVPDQRAVVLGSNAVLTQSLAEIYALECLVEPGLLVAVGRLSKEKGFDILLNAVALLRERRSIKLIIVGEGPDRPDLEAQIHRLNLGEIVELVGFQDDPGLFLKRAEVFVSASRHEGLGNAIIEALSWGLPVVSTDAPYGPREVLQNGRWGVLVPVDDPHALADAIEAELLQYHDNQRGKERAADFTVENAARALINALENIGIRFH